ncbi:hypothetical protein B0H19DRAFT_1345957 [Mycena capillaripes]|nr:hypothetical protein B0H19DRAFT_1345957 [Mycena capillaripes]
MVGGIADLHPTRVFVEHPLAAPGLTAHLSSNRTLGAESVIYAAVATAAIGIVRLPTDFQRTAANSDGNQLRTRLTLTSTVIQWASESSLYGHEGLYPVPLISVAFDPWKYLEVRRQSLANLTGRSDILREMYMGVTPALANRFRLLDALMGSVWMLGNNKRNQGVAHHLFDEHLDARSVSGRWTQTTTSRIEIFLATAFRIFFCFSAGVSLCQLSWYSLRRQPVTLPDIDALVGEPSLMILYRRNLFLKMPLIILMTLAILASPVITILAPSLNTQKVSAVSRALIVPNLNTTTDAVMDDVYLRQIVQYGSVTETWDKTALVALLSDNPVGWTMPDGCSPECEYNITYAAPALRCSDLQPNQISDGILDVERFVSRDFADPPSAYLLGYDGLALTVHEQMSALNFTVQNAATLTSSLYNLTLAYVPFLASNANKNALINAAGSACTFYNATHTASTHYFNGTQESHVTVKEFHDPLNTMYRHLDGPSPVIGPPTLFTNSTPSDTFGPGIGAHVHLLAMADSLSQRLQGSVIFDSFHGDLNTTTFMLETNIFEPFSVADLRAAGAEVRLLGINTTAHVTNVSQALQDIVANATLGFLNLNTGSIPADATVRPTDTVYVYDRTTLIATYAVAFFLLVVMSGVGMCSMVMNGEPSSNKFSRLLVVLRNPELDAVAEAVEGRPVHGVPAHRVQLRFGDRPPSGRQNSRVFGVVPPRNGVEEDLEPKN